MKTSIEMAITVMNINVQMTKNNVVLCGLYVSIDINYI